MKCSIQKIFLVDDGFLIWLLARSVEDQQHRFVASGADVATGLKTFVWKSQCHV